MRLNLSFLTIIKKMFDGNPTTSIGDPKSLCSPPPPPPPISVAPPALHLKTIVSVSAPVLGLPPMIKRKGGVRCSMVSKQGNVSAMGG
ncbi:unnamed protein product [Brassica rapa]|uniref:Uncharacterized protein n=1 Tax=Brassica campestris TaxID=3711 RepID=A0A8D9MDE4_BRACM|nr:unnamed protein product [Brassica rapa]